MTRQLWWAMHATQTSNQAGVPPSAACSEGNGANLDLKIPQAKGWTKTYQLYTYYMVCVHGYENMGWSFRFYGVMNWRITGINQAMYAGMISGLGRADPTKITILLLHTTLW